MRSASIRRRSQKPKSTGASSMINPETGNEMTRHELAAWKLVAPLARDGKALEDAHKLNDTLKAMLREHEITIENQRRASHEDAKRYAALEQRNVKLERAIAVLLSR